MGHHAATIHQVFLVVQGQGWVAGKDGVRMTLQAGQGAYWEPGEEHAAGTEAGLMAVVIESEELDAAEHLAALMLRER